ncbi:hypothetical protein SAMN05421767_10721 [Granulicatella balaenopterae]|uniref:Major Facilitator Superfamily protein n=1 Tax=Granulicatella balaenopterae TaxID=137733 RepID=A0A1H9IYR2_9LACT|nr:MFS transporter [Granulicatella balaenopterae]SEQ79637.1 hypothetical protein SAMN05421767_10721 [Granulicatella balaenopterae]
MNILKKYPKNFKYLILGKSTLNIADSFYAIAITIGLVSVYNVDASNLTLFALTTMIPRVFAFLYTPLLLKLSDTKKWLLVCQIIHLCMVGSILVAFSQAIPLMYIYVMNLIFNLVNCILMSIQIRLVPESLNDDPDLINKSVDIQYMTSNTLDIISNFVASILLGVVSFFVVMEMSIPFFIAGAYFIYQLKLKRTLGEQQDEAATIEAEEETNHKKLSVYLTHLNLFFKQKTTAKIIIIEAFLSGATDLLLTLMPLYLLDISIDVKWLGLAVAVRRTADILGSFIAPIIKIQPKLFFCFDYVISGSCFLAVFLVENIYLKLIFFFITFIVVGISGNFFEKMMYADYDSEELSIVYTIITSLFSIFGVVFMFIPFIYSNITVLGISLNIMTIVFGVYLFIKMKASNYQLKQ